MTRLRIIVLCAALMPLWCVEGSLAWNDETHIAIARAAGYEKWYNAAGVDMIKLPRGLCSQSLFQRVF